MSASAIADRRITARAFPLGPSSVGVTAFLLAALFDVLLKHETGHSGDEPYYVRMAQHPAGAHNFPYAFRIGVPYLVHVLPFHQSFSWAILALIAAAVASGALYALLTDLDVPPALAAGLALGFVVSPPLLVVFLRNGVSVDPASIMMIALGALFIERRHIVRLALTLLIGVTIHEPCMFLILFAYAFWAEQPIDREAVRDLVRAAAIPVVAYIYLRMQIIAVGESYQPGYEGPFITERIDVLKDALGSGGWKVELRRLALIYGPLWVAAPFAVRQLRFTQRGLVLVALCVASMTFALDWGRAIFYAAPVIYASAAYALRSRRTLAILCVATLACMDVGYAAYMQVHGVTHGLDSTGPPARGPVH